MLQSHDDARGQLRKEVNMRLCPRPFSPFGTLLALLRVPNKRASVSSRKIRSYRGSRNSTERAGFEPAVQIESVHRFSKPTPSAARPSLLEEL